MVCTIALNILQQKSVNFEIGEFEAIVTGSENSEIHILSKGLRQLTSYTLALAPMWKSDLYD